MKKCPFCAEDIQDAAVKCKYCGARLEKISASATEESSPATPADRAKPFLLSLVSIIGSLAFFAAAAVLFSKGIILIGVATAGSGVIFFYIAPLGWSWGDLFRKFAQRYLYFDSPQADVVEKDVFWLYVPQTIGVVMVLLVLALVLAIASGYFTGYRIGIKNKLTINHDSTKHVEVVKKKPVENRAVSQEETMNANNGQIALAEKLNAIITWGTLCGISMANTDLMDKNARRGELLDRVAATKRNIEKLKEGLEKLSTSDPLYTEPLALVKDGLQILTDAVRNYNRYYYAEDEDEEAQCAHVMRQKATDANEDFLKASGRIRIAFSGDTKGIYCGTFNQEYAYVLIKSGKDTLKFICGADNSVRGHTIGDSIKVHWEKRKVYNSVTHDSTTTPMALLVRWKV